MNKDDIMVENIKIKSYPKLDSYLLIDKIFDKFSVRLILNQNLL
jgi:hypothetical protein